MTVVITASIVEEIVVACLETLRYAVLHGSDIAAGEPDAEHSAPNYRAVRQCSWRKQFTVGNMNDV